MIVEYIQVKLGFLAVEVGAWNIIIVPTCDGMYIVNTQANSFNACFQTMVKQQLLNGIYQTGYCEHVKSL